jgi:hypothetical protein
MLDEILERVRAARRVQDYAKAEVILLEAQEKNTDPEARLAIQEQLFYLYSAPVYEDLDNAESCLRRIDELAPSAHNGLNWTMFMLNCRNNSNDAKRWARICATRAESEKSEFIIYQAVSVLGFISAKGQDVSEVSSCLRKLQSLILKGVLLPWGDEVLFLEACLTINDETRAEAIKIAQRTSNWIEDAEFRARAERVAAALSH